MSEVTLADFSEHLMLIATTTREGEIRLWDFEKGNFVCKLKSTNKEVLAMQFLHPFPLLVTTDAAGTLCVHIVRPHKHETQLAVVWKNMFTIMKAAQVTCLDHVTTKADDLRLVLGDENGDLRVLDL
jgi:WD40 repeat protein